MDGNGRWANSRGLPRIAGHREGVRTVRKITEICGELDVQILTLYTFSSENWNRPQTEVSALMKLLVNSLRREVKDLMKNNVRFTVIGDINELEGNVQNELLDSIQKTKNNTPNFFFLRRLLRRAGKPPFLRPYQRQPAACPPQAAIFFPDSEDRDLSIGEVSAPMDATNKSYG